MTNLLWASVSDETARRYRKDLRLFIKWLDYFRFEPLTVEEIDLFLYQYINDIFHALPSRGRRQHCIQVRSALMIVLPQSRDKLPTSALALKGWDRLTPSSQKPPCPRAVMLALVRHFAQKRRLDLAVLTFLMFDTYLRVSEATAIILADISLPAQSVPGGIRLPKTKTGQNQSVLIHNNFLWSLLRRHLSAIPLRPNDRIFSVSAAIFSREMSQALVALGLGAFGFTPHSLRHGGASFDHLSEVPLADIISRGRWRQQKSAQRYIQSGRALLLSSRLPVSVLQVDQEWQSNPEQFLLSL
jgi:integrase